MSAQAAAAITALFATGAIFISTALLLLFNPHNRSVRWFTLFNVAIIAWLGIQGAALAMGVRPMLIPAFAYVVHMLPAFFLAATVAQSDAPQRRWWPWAPIAAGLALLLFIEPGGSASRAWHVLGWSSAAAVYLWRAFRGRGRGKRLARPGTSRSEKVLEVVLSAFVPIGVAGAVLAQGAFVLFVLPLTIVAIHLLLFVGIVYHRYYDIEVRAARSSELASSAAEQDRLALLGELSATVAHEVRNPLTGIRSLAQMLVGPGIDDDRRRRYAGVIMDEVSRLDRIVGNLTDLARRRVEGDARIEHVALRTLFEDLRLLIGSRATRAGVTVVAEDGGLSVTTQRDALAQTLLNLLLNAIAHAPPGTAVELAAARSGAATMITVSDAGPGVPEEDRERIFEPFRTRGGTGLGLAVVRRLAGEHGWCVDVVPREGGGARFRLLVPEAATAGVP